MEVSAKEGTNIDVLFLLMIKKILTRQRLHILDIDIGSDEYEHIQLC